MKNNASKFPLPVGKSWSRLPERVSKLRQEVDEIIANPSSGGTAKNILAETLELSGDLSFVGAYKETGKVIGLPFTPSSSEPGIITAYWNNGVADSSVRTFFYTQGGPATIGSTVAGTITTGNYTSEFLDKYGDILNGYTGILTLSIESNGVQHFLTINVSSSIYDGMMAQGYNIIGTIVDSSANFPYYSNFYFLQGGQQINSISYTKVTPAKYGVKLDINPQELFLDNPSFIKIGDTEEILGDVISSDLPGVGLYLSIDSLGEGALSFSYGNTDANKVLEKLAFLQSLNTPFDITVYNSMMQSTTTYTIGSILSVANETVMRQITLYVTGTTPTNSYTSYYYDMNKPYGFVFPGAKKITSEILESLDTETIYFSTPIPNSISIGNSFSTLPFTTSIEFKNLAGESKKVISYDISTQEVTYPGLIEKIKTKETNNGQLLYTSDVNSQTTDSVEGQRIALGKNANVTGLGSVGIGENTVATTDSTVVGSNSTGNNTSTVFGNSNYSPSYGTVLGRGNNLQTSDKVFGNNNQASGYTTLIGDSKNIPGHTFGYSVGQTNSMRLNFQYFRSNWSTQSSNSGARYVGLNGGILSYPSSSNSDSIFLGSILNGAYYFNVEATVCIKELNVNNTQEYRVEKQKFIVKSTTSGSYLISPITTEIINQGTGTIKNLWSGTFEIHNSYYLVFKFNQSTDTSGKNISISAFCEATLLT